jgi:hypothetical protein
MMWVLSGLGWAAAVVSDDETEREHRARDAFAFS